MYEVSNDNKRECAWCDECNIVQESYAKGRADGAREFANKLIDKCKENYENKDLALECKKCMIWRREEILEAFDEYEKEQKHGRAD